MESTLDIRVKQGRLFCAPALDWNHNMELLLPASPAKLARPAVKNIAQVFCVCFICFCPEYIPEIAQNNLND